MDKGIAFFENKEKNKSKKPHFDIIVSIKSSRVIEMASKNPVALNDNRDVIETYK